jgi:hypothetical protein
MSTRVTGRLGLQACHAQAEVGQTTAERNRVHASRPGESFTICGEKKGMTFLKRWKSLRAVYAGEVRDIGMHFCRQCVRDTRSHPKPLPR